jgi:hypothetical protein
LSRPGEGAGHGGGRGARSEGRDAAVRGREDEAMPSRAAGMCCREMQWG